MGSFDFSRAPVIQRCGLSFREPRLTPGISHHKLRTGQMSASRTHPLDCLANQKLTSALVELRQVTKDYVADGQSVRALHEVSLTVKAGEFVTVVGRSGCGKSTLLNLAGAMDYPTSGEVLIDGVSTASLNDDGLTCLRRQKVGFVFQSFQLLHTLTAIENVELPLLLAGTANARALARERLAWVEFEALAARYPHQLSGGQMQRVAIARALAQPPRLLLADEPTGNLDTTTSEGILNLLRLLTRQQNTATIMATHSAEAAAIADVLVRLRDGHVEEVVRR